MVGEYPIQGFTLYTAECRNGSRGCRLNNPWAFKPNFDHFLTEPAEKIRYSLSRRSC